MKVPLIDGSIFNARWEHTHEKLFRSFLIYFINYIETAGAWCYLEGYSIIENINLNLASLSTTV